MTQIDGMMLELQYMYLLHSTEHFAVLKMYDISSTTKFYSLQ